MTIDGLAPMILTVGPGVGTVAASAVARRILERRRVLDHPNARSSHSRPVTRGVGVAFAAVWAGTAMVIASLDGGRTAAIGPAIALAVALALVGLRDDVGGLSPFSRLAIQVALCGGAVAAGVRVDSLRVPGLPSIGLGPLAAAFSLVMLVAVVNLFNFMDGIDGLAAGQTAVAASMLAVGAVIVNQPTIVWLALALAGASAGFLPFNWSPARCFMGDAGSYFCGGALGALLLIAERQGVPLLVVGLASAAFLLDGTLTVARRLLAGEAFWRPHRSHLYQRMVAAGWSHAQVTGAYLVTATVLGTVGVVWLMAALR